MRFLIVIFFVYTHGSGRFHSNVIKPQTIENVAPLVENVLVEACHEFAILTAAREDGSLPEDWRDQSRGMVHLLLSSGMTVQETESI